MKAANTATVHQISTKIAPDIGKVVSETTKMFRPEPPRKKRRLNKTVKIQYEKSRSKSAKRGPKPLKWREVWRKIEGMCLSEKEYVDTMGKATVKSPAVIDPKAVDQGKAYHTLIGLMLSSSTAVVANRATMKVLVDEKNLSIDTILKTPIEELEKWIAKVGFFKKKAIYIKKTT